MITLSARCLSRAWLAVQFAAAGPDHPSAQLSRAVHVEQFDNGVRLIACDGFWLAHCWVPAWDVLEDLNSSPAGVGTIADDDHVGVTPNLVGTVRDVDLRVRDLMRFLHRATKPAESLDLPVDLDLAGILDDTDTSTPTLLPEWAERAAIFTIPTGERVVAEEFDAPWISWRDIVARAHRVERAGCTIVVPERLDRLAKVANTVAAESVQIVWNNGLNASWWCNGPGNLAHMPAGIFTFKTPGDDSTIDSDAVMAAVADAINNTVDGVTVDIVRPPRGAR